MQHFQRPLPGWFRAVFIAVMLLLCAFLCWFAVEQHQLRYQTADLALSLDTSRQREAKQRFEYGEVTLALPETRAAAAELIPQAEAALATETELRARRKALRQDHADMVQQLADLESETRELTRQAEALRAEVDALAARKAELEALLADE